jgi:hypothetical protein
MTYRKPPPSALDADCVIIESTPQVVDTRAYFRRMESLMNAPDPTGDYLVDMVWWTEKLDELPLGEMSRAHVRNALQWCLPRVGRDKSKDGHTYQEWVTAFTIRLLDPTLP